MSRLLDLRRPYRAVGSRGPVFVVGSGAIWLFGSLSAQLPPITRPNDATALHLNSLSRLDCRRLAVNLAGVVAVVVVDVVDPDELANATRRNEKGIHFEEAALRVQREQLLLGVLLLAKSELRAQFNLRPNTLGHTSWPESGSQEEARKG